MPFLRIVAFLTNVCAWLRKVTLKYATPKEVNTPIAQKIVCCVSLSIGKWIIFLNF